MSLVEFLLGIIVIQMFVLIRGNRNQSNIIAELSVKIQDHLSPSKEIKAHSIYDAMGKPK
jgi:hypothetical protein